MTRYTQGLRAHAVALYTKGLSTREVAQTVGVSKQSVYDWVKRHGVVRCKYDADRAFNGRRRHRNYDELEARAASLLEAGMTVPAVARVLDVGQSTVRRWRTKRGISSITMGQHFTQKHLRDITRAYSLAVDSEQPLEEVARLFGASLSTVTRWLREYRKHISVKHASISSSRSSGAAGGGHRRHGDRGGSRERGCGPEDRCFGARTRTLSTACG